MRPPQSPRRPESERPVQQAFTSADRDLPILLIAACLLLAGCDDSYSGPGYSQEIRPENVDRAAAWIIAAVAADNASPNGPEDDIDEVYDVALDLFGEPVRGEWREKYPGGSYVFIPDWRDY